jgi:hypothetical protein
VEQVHPKDEHGMQQSVPVQTENYGIEEQHDPAPSKKALEI